MKNANLQNNTNDKLPEPARSSIGMVPPATSDAKQDQGAVRVSASFNGKASTTYSREDHDDRSSTPARRDENTGPASGEWAANSWTNEWIWPANAFESTRVMWDAGGKSECSLATHMLHAAAHVNKSKMTPFKFNIQPLTCKEEYENWAKDLQQALGEC